MTRSCVTARCICRSSIRRSDARKVQNAPFKMSETPAENRLPSPLIGQHTREIVEGLLRL